MNTATNDEDAVTVSAATRRKKKETPELFEVKGGWFARGNGWAVRGKTREEAIARFEAAVILHAEILARDPDWRARNPDSSSRSGHGALDAESLGSSPKSGASS